MKTLHVYISHAPADASFMRQLALQLEGISNIKVIVDQLHAPPVSFFIIHPALKEADIVIALLSPDLEKSEKALQEIAYAVNNGKKVFALMCRQTTLPVSLEKASFIDITNPPEQLSQLESHLKNFRKKISVSALINSLNPFRKRYKPYDDFPDLEFDMDFSSDQMATTGSASGRSSRTGAPKYTGNRSYKAGKPSYAGAAPPAPAAAAPPPPPPSPLSSKGKLLYDIPDSMIVKKQYQCIVRIAESEIIVRDNDRFSGGEVIKDISIARVMNVELIDINNPPCFSIIKINSDTQEIEKDNYSQWLFMITPLMEGVHNLFLKVSIIREIDGKEVRREIVYDKAINIISTAPEPAVTSDSKNLLDEEGKEFDTPAVFVSYAHSDKIYFDAFLKNLQAESGWNIWTDKNIEIGSDWFQRIQDAIKDTDIAVLLVSAYFISSGFIKEHEYAKFDELNKLKNGFVFMPVLLRDTNITRWKELSKLQFFSADGADYNVPAFRGKLMPFASLCTFNEKGELNENAFRDTYIKTFVSKANTDWMASKKHLFV